MKKMLALLCALSTFVAPGRSKLSILCRWICGEWLHHA
nr:MAG TPA: hypothetical protein [Caudoviricetes sp.]